jgi:hypothetical protein
MVFRNGFTAAGAEKAQLTQSSLIIRIFKFQIFELRALDFGLRNGTSQLWHDCLRQTIPGCLGLSALKIFFHHLFNAVVVQEGVVVDQHTV